LFGGLVSDGNTDVAVFASLALNRLSNVQRVSGCGFKNAFGRKDVNLNKGTYYLAGRNQVSGSNFVRVELDYQTKPIGWYFADWGIYDTDYLDSGYTYWQTFVVEPGVRYYMDGANTGLDTYVMDESELSYFDRGDDFYYYTAYSRSTTDMPGFYELKLKPGRYALGLINDYDEDSAFTYEMELFTRTGNLRSEFGVPGVPGAIEQSGGVVIPRQTMTDATAGGDATVKAKFTRARRRARLLDLLKVPHPEVDKSKPMPYRPTGLERLFGATSATIR